MVGVHFAGKTVQEQGKAKHSVLAVTGARYVCPHVLMLESASPDASVVMGELFVMWTAPTLVS